jgi:hypothetical protein
MGEQIMAMKKDEQLLSLYGKPIMPLQPNYLVDELFRTSGRFDANPLFATEIAETARRR